MQVIEVWTQEATENVDQINNNKNPIYHLYFPSHKLSKKYKNIDFLCVFQYA